MDNQTSSDFPHSSGVSPALAFFDAAQNQAFRLLEAGRLSRVSSNLSVMTDGSLENDEFPLSSRFLVLQNGEFGGPCGEFAVGGSLGGTVGVWESVCRKRKEIFCNGNAGEAPVSPANRQHWKLAEVESTNLKRTKSIGGTSGKGKSQSKQVRGVSPSAEKPGEDNASMTSENSTKDYIHVRARRGQATDSHSLAERVRREKISERKKFLQDLVPGCNKVTGEAVMLDEIINYVQSLQRQVEFLSMKLATVNPHLQFNMENLLQKNIQQLRGYLPSHLNNPMDVSALTMPFSPQPSQSNPVQCNVTNGMDKKINHINSLDTSPRQTIHPQSTLYSFEHAHSQLGTLWEDDLQSVVQMGLLKNQKTTFSHQQFHGAVPTYKKLEL